MLNLRSATLAFGDRHLFSNLDLIVERGQLVGVTGESGCGKTSLLRAILGFVPLTSGTVEVDGLPLDAHHISEIRRRTAYVPQELQPAAETGRDLFSLTHNLEANRHHAPNLDANHHNAHVQASSTTAVADASSPGRLPSGHGGCSSLLSLLGLDSSLLDLSASKLSGGQRQRFLLAAALSLPKPLLLLDEPSSALDEESTQRVGLALLRACHEHNRSALIVSHDPVLLSFCDKLVNL